MGYITIASLWCVMAVVMVVSNEIQIGEASQKYNDCLDYCKIEFRKDAVTCFIFCNMRCMPSLGYDCRDTGVSKLKVPIGSKSYIGEAANSDPPASPVLKSIAQSPLPQFFKTMEKRSSIPELQQFLEELAPNYSLASSPSNKN